MRRKLLLLLALFLLTLTVNAAKVDSIAVYSAKMEKEIKVTVIVPDDVDGEKLPVLYLLHGFGGDEKTWVRISTIDQLADNFKMIVVCPDGENSWYWDSPTDPKSQFETFVSRELTSYIDNNYNTIADRSARAITGLSMGGHGGMWLSIRNKDIFGAGGSMSGGVDIRPFPTKWQMSKQLGSYDANKEVWDNHTVINELDELKNGELAIIFDCGKDDFFFEVNNALHAKLDEKGIDHDYVVRPGAHTAKYWANSIIYQATYFSRFFNKLY